MKRSLLLTYSILSLNILCIGKDIMLNSPSKKLTVTITSTPSGLNLHLMGSKKSILHVNAGKFVFDKTVSQNEYEITDVKKSSTNETWYPVYGEKNTISNKYNELTLILTNKTNSKNTLNIVIRMYDEGMAFRYIFDRKFAAGLIMQEELTTFDFEADHEVWLTNRAQATYKKDKISSIDNGCERPLVIKQNESTYLALGEAALVDFARMKFKKNKNHQLSIRADLDGAVDLQKANFISPWRYVMVADSPGKLLENNYFILNLNEPNEIEDTSWIKPGKVIREVTLTTQGGIACIDFAAKHNLQYVEFDAGWYGNEYDDASDASTITVDPKRSPGPLDLHHIIDYANKKGIGIILYVNRRALEKQIDELLPLYQSWGIKGLKYGFVNVGSQEWTSWLHEAIRKAAKYQLMVDVHDEYRPTGYSRTYPNFMTQEGIRGDEESPSTEHSLTTLFTRMVAGAGDNTNCYLAPRVVEKMGGKAGQMAKAIMLYSSWQFVYWYDRPEGSPHKKGGAGAATGILMENENLDFYDALPTVWDDTKILEGEIGEYATVARKRDDIWFVGSMTAKQDRNVNVSMDFLDKKGNYEAIMFYQDEDALKNNIVKTEKISMNQKSALSRKLLQNSGLAIIIRKI